MNPLLAAFCWEGGIELRPRVEYSLFTLLVEDRSSEVVAEAVSDWVGVEDSDRIAG